MIKALFSLISVPGEPFPRDIAQERKDLSSALPPIPSKVYFCVLSKAYSNHMGIRIIQSLSYPQVIKREHTREG
jgi:hypothetical protein